MTALSKRFRWRSDPAAGKGDEELLRRFRSLGIRNGPPRKVSDSLRDEDDTATKPAEARTMKAKTRSEAAKKVARARELIGKKNGTGRIHRPD